MAEELQKTETWVEKDPDAKSDDPVIVFDHVDMIFNIASEQLNNLKEYFIKLVRRELFFEEFKALKDISFTINRGEVYGVVGSNGSGKSTLLKLVAGVLEPSNGTVTVNGTIAPIIELGAGFDFELTARENVYLNGALLGYSKKFMDEKYDRLRRDSRFSGHAHQELLIGYGRAHRLCHRNRYHARYPRCRRGALRW